MATTLNEKILKAKGKVAKLEQQQRLEKRLKQEAERKKDKRRHYIIGELVEKYIPEVRYFEPGTKAENTIEFKPLEIFLSTLAADQNWITRLKEAMNQKLSVKNNA